MTKNPTGTNVPTPKPKTSAKKPVGITFLNDLVKETNSRTKYYLDESKDNFIEYNKVFAKDTRDDLIKELVETVEYCNQNNINYLKLDIQIKQYTHFLMIKYFSSFDKMFRDKDFNYHIQVMNNMYKTGLYDLFFHDIFNKDEVQQVIDHLDLIESMLKNYVSQVENEKSKLQESVSNQALLDKALPLYDEKLN